MSNGNPEKGPAQLPPPGEFSCNFLCRKPCLVSLDCQCFLYFPVFLLFLHSASYLL